MSSNKKSRRKFIKNSALASSLFIIPRHVLGGNGYTAPSDKLNLAGIGLHGNRWGWVDWTGFGVEQLSGINTHYWVLHVINFHLSLHL